MTDDVDRALGLVMKSMEQGLTWMSSRPANRRASSIDAKQLAAVIEEKGAPTADGLTNVLDMDLERYSGRSYPGFRT